LFYAPDELDEGAFHWCAPEERVAHKDQSLPLHLLTDVFYGKAESGFRNPAFGPWPRTAASASEDCCVSLTTADIKLDLEADSADIANNGETVQSKCLTLGQKLYCACGRLGIHHSLGELA
jgi:hypothetical protein